MLPKLVLLGEASVLHVPMHIPEYSLDLSRSSESLPHQYSKRGGGGLASEEKVIFVLKLLGSILPVHFHRFQRKKYLRNWDKSHRRASSGPLRASTTKRSPYHFQSDHILQFPICVLKNLMITSSASIHIDRRHSHDRDSFSGRWPLRQAGKRDL